MDSCEEARFESRVFMTMCGIVVSWIALPHFYSCCWKVQRHTRFVQRQACSCQQDQWNKFENKSWCKLAGSRWIHANVIHFFRRRRGLQWWSETLIHCNEVSILSSYLTWFYFPLKSHSQFELRESLRLAKGESWIIQTQTESIFEFVDFEDTVPKDCFSFWHVSSLACLTALRTKEVSWVQK